MRTSDSCYLHKTMAGSLLLKQLSEGKVENIATGVKDYLSPVFTQDLTDSDRYTYGLFGVKFLHGSVKWLTSETADSLLSSIQLAYLCYRQTKGLVQLSEPLLMLKVLYHILTKLPHKESVDDITSVASYIQEDVGDKLTKESSVSNILTGVCHTLWNYAIKSENSVNAKVNKATLAESALKLRHMALKFMILRKNDIAIIVDKTLITSARFEHVLMSGCKKGDYSWKEQMWALPSEVCDDVCSLLTQSYDHDTSLQTNLVLMRIHQCRYLWSQNMLTEARNSIDLLQQCLRQTKNSTPDLCLPALLHTACLLFRDIKTNLEESKNKNLTKPLSKKDSNFQLLSGIVEECHCLLNQEISAEDKRNEDLFTAFVLASSCLIAEAKTLLNSSVCCPSNHSILDLLRLVTSVLSVQSKFHSGHPAGEVSSIQRTWAWNVQPKKTLSSSYLLQLHYLYTICKAQGSDSMDDLTSATDLILSFEKILPQMAQGKADKSSLHDKHCLGNMAQKFGSLCYNMRKYETAVQFYRTACHHHTDWCRTDPQELQQKSQEVGLWQYYDCLADCYRQLGQHETAMDTVTDCLLVDNSHLMSAAKLWGRAKKELLKKGQISQEVLLVTMLDGVSKKGADLPTVEKKALLKSELQIYRTYRSVCRMHKAEYSVLEQLLVFTKDAVERASLLVEEVKLLWLNPSLSPDRCIVALAEQAMKLLSNSGTKQKPGYAMAAADAHLWLYIVQSNQLCKLSYENLYGSNQSSEEPENQDTDLTEDKPVMKITKIKSPSMTITMETRLTDLLDKAVELWDSCVEDNKQWVDVKICPAVKSIQLCAAIYCLAGKPLKALQTLQVAQKLCVAKTDASCMSTINVRLSKLLLELGLPSAGNRILENCDSPSDLSHTVMMAEIALILGDTSLCVEKASAVLEKVEGVSRTRDSCHIEGCVLRLLSRVMRVSRSLTEERLGARANSAHLALESVRCHTSVVHHLLGKHLNESIASKGATAIERWLSVKELLTSLLHLGQTYILIGYARGASCYLEEGLRLSNALNLPRWCAWFLTELARLSLLAGCAEDTAIHLDQVRDILMSKLDHTALPDAASQSSISMETNVRGDNYCNTSGTGNMNSTGSRGCFGFDSPVLSTSQDEDQQEDFILHTVPMTMRDRGMSEDSETSHWSPVFHVNAEPDTLHHRDDCRCGICADVTSHRLYVEYLLTLSEHYLSNSGPDKALDALGYLKRFLNGVATRMSSTINCCSAGSKSAGNPVNLKKASLASLESNSSRFTGTETLPLWFRLARGKLHALLCEAHHQNGQSQRALEAVKLGQEQISDLISVVPEVTQLRARLHIWHAQVLLVTVVPQREKLLGVKATHMGASGPCKISRPGSDSGQNAKTPFTRKEKTSAKSKDRVNSIRVDLDNLMICDEDNIHTPEIKTVFEKSDGSPVCTKTVKLSSKKTRKSRTETGGEKFEKEKKTRGNKKEVAIILESDLEDEDDVLPVKTTRSRKHASKSTKKAPKSEVLEADDDTCNHVSSEDICSRLGQLSINKRASNKHSAGHTKYDVSVKVDKQVKAKKDNHCEGRGTNMKKEILENDELINDSKRRLKLSHHLENCQEEIKVEKSEKNKKTYSKKNPKSATPAKISPGSEKSSVQKSLFDFDVLDDSKCGKLKSRKMQRKKTTIDDLPVKTTRRTRKNQATEIESGRVLETSEIFSDLNIPVLPLPFSPDNHQADVDSYNLEDTWEGNVIDLKSCNAISDYEESCSPVKELDFERSFLPLELSPNLSVEMIRAGSDEEDKPLRRKTTRRKPANKLPVATKEVSAERELPRTSCVTEFSDELGNPCCKLKQRRSKSSETNVKVQNMQTDSDSTTDSDSITTADLTDVSRHLDAALRMISEFPPLLLYRDVCHAMALQCLTTSPLNSAHFLSEAMAITLRHRALSNTVKKEKLSSKGKCAGVSPLSGLDNLSHHDLQFNQSHNIIPSLLDILPEEWSICMVSVVKTAPGVADLLVTRLEKHTDPVIKHMTGYRQSQTFVSDFNDILEASRQSMKLTDKIEWWKTRQHLDETLQELLERLEDSWLQGWKGLLLGQLSQSKQQLKLTEMVDNILKSRAHPHLSKQSAGQLWKLVMSSVHSLSEDQLSEVVTELTGVQADTAPHCELISQVTQMAQLLKARESPRHPLILILDQPIQQLPWESIPVLRGQPVCRLSSLHHLYSQLRLEMGRGRSAIREGIDPQSTYYILNPDNNLPATRERFTPIFAKQKGWTGLTSVAPTKEQFTAALADHQLVVYCGHGSGNKFLHGDDLQFVQCQAVTILMGCSSGKLQAHGQLEPIGMMHNYFLAGCPCVVACLWDVTDRDIDRLTENLLNIWLTDDNQKSLTHILAKSRNSCRLSYLIGAAPVVYGLPVHLQ